MDVFDFEEIKGMSFMNMIIFYASIVDISLDFYCFT